MRDYLAVTYDLKKSPFTDYPNLLVRYCVDRFNLVPGKKILDFGCGRGEFLQGFIQCGLDGYGVDKSLYAKDICPEAAIVSADLAQASLPFSDNTFDYIFSKSVLEHFYYPENLVLEMHRVLAPGGQVIALVPDWESIYKKEFYDDYTHRTSYTCNSFRELFVVNGFNDVSTEKFRQLPILWKYPSLVIFSWLASLLMPRILGAHSKFIRFSKELMLLTSARK